MPLTQQREHLRLERRVSRSPRRGQRLLEELSFEAGKAGVERVSVDAAYVDARLQTLAQREDLARYVL